MGSREEGRGVVSGGPRELVVGGERAEGVGPVALLAEEEELLAEAEGLVAGGPRRKPGQGGAAGGHEGSGSQTGVQGKESLRCKSLLSLSYLDSFKARKID